MILAGSSISMPAYDGSTCTSMKVSALNKTTALRIPGVPNHGTRTSRNRQNFSTPGPVILRTVFAARASAR